MTLFARLWLPGMLVLLSAVIGVRAPSLSAVPRRNPSADTRYEFKKTISQATLNSYLSRAVTHYGLCSTSPEPASTYFDDDLRMLTALGAKFIGRAAYAWVPPEDDEAHFRQAKERADKVHARDPDIILQACVFEAVYTGVGKIPVPQWVFEEFRLPYERRGFRYAAMLYEGGRYLNHWTAGASVPDMSKLETRMYFYYRARRYIDSGFEAIHFGQVHLMDQNDGAHRYWLDMLTRVRRYAARNARRNLVLCDAHTHGIIVNGNQLLFDFHAWPQRPRENRAKPMQTRLQVGYGDAIYGSSMGGIAPSGWTCASLPYLVEFDSFGSSGKGGKPGVGFPWVWGYDEADWLARLSASDRATYLREAANWLQARHENGWLEMPTRLNLAEPVDGNKLWHANTRSPACPVGYNLEEAIKAIWNGNSPGGTAK